MGTFSERLEIVFNHYELNAAAFADKIGVQRSSISHLLSGRNNPSLDFVIKVLDEFPEINFDWFVKGKGEAFMKSETKTSEPVKQRTTPTLFDQEFVETPNQPISNNPKTVDKIEKVIANEEKKIRPIARVLILFKDGSFETYT